MLFNILFLLTFFSSTYALTCSSPDVKNFTEGHCIHIRSLTVTGNGRYPVEDQCSQLNEYPFTWHLPKLDTRKKNNELHSILDNSTIDTQSVFRIGLVRDPATNEEASTMALWQDPSKWRWVSDNSTLDSSFPGESPPWLQNPKEPSNHGFDANSRENCVIIFFDRMSPFQWHDVRCDFDPRTVGYSDVLLVCESEIDHGSENGTEKGIRTSTKNDSQENEDVKETFIIDNSRWNYFVSGMVIGVVAYSVIIAIGWYVKKRYLDKVEKLHGRMMVLESCERDGNGIQKL